MRLLFQTLAALLVSFLVPPFPLGIRTLGLMGEGWGEGPSHEALIPYANRWYDQDYGNLDLLSLLRCDVSRWKGRPNPAFPVTVGGFTMAYDSLRERLVLFFGADAQGLNLVSETWEWDGAVWERKSLEGPPPRVNQAMVYDGARQVTFLFGGQGYDETHSIKQLLNDTWIWDGIVWTELLPAESPGPRAGHAMAFDSQQAQVVLFGGDSTDSLDLQGPFLNDTWIWDGVTWTEVPVLNALSPRFHHAMTHDSVRGRTVLFGGHAEDAPVGDTWEWDGSNWSEVTAAHMPSNRRGHAMTFDSDRGVVILFGGELGVGFSRETWEYDGVDWILAPIGNSPESASVALAYDGARKEVVLFTGDEPVGTYLNDGEPSCPEQDNQE